MTLVDVARAAAAEVEEYQRVEFLPLADLEVAGHAAVDVIHLLAELVENAHRLLAAQHQGPATSGSHARS